MNKKTGTSMCGSMFKSKRINKKERIKQSEKKKNAKVCIKCDSNQEGYCIKHKAWCNKVNHICNGQDMSISEKAIRSREKILLKEQNKVNKTKSKPKSKKNKSGIGLVKPNFDTTNLVRKRGMGER